MWPMPGADRNSLNNRFCVNLRVYWEDTDAGGVVYYANYLRFLERARTEWLRALGFSQQDLAAQHGVLFAVTRVQIDYLRPARLDDELVVTCEPRRVGAASVSFAQDIRCISTPGVLAAAEVRIACLDTRSFRPLRMPEFLLSALEAQEKP